MKTNQSIVAFLCLLLALPMQAQVRRVGDAQRLADQFWPMKRGGENIRPEMVYTEEDTVSRHPFFYVFNRGDNQGYVIISADERSKKIIGYSDSGSFVPDSVPPELQAWLRVCRSELQQLAVTPDSLLKMDLGQFVLSKGRAKGSQSFAASVSPLLGQINYAQTYPYNALCPQVSGQSCVTGCVATAAAQVMRYWAYPTQPTGKSHSYQLYGQPVGTTYNTSYDWSNMLASYSNEMGSQQEREAVARLMADAGVACDMRYSPSQSAAYTNQMALGMIEYFGYDKGVMAYKRADFTQADFTYYLKRELNAGRPVLVSGKGSGGGHCFVCDGYDANGLFHVNWGWNGTSNGYFELSNLSPSVLGTGGGTGGFNDEVVFYGGLQPPRIHSKPVYVLSFKTMAGSLNMTKGKPFTFTLEQITNASLFNYTGQIGVALYQDGLQKAVLAAKPVKIGADYLLNSLTITGKFPTQVADGNYQIVMVCKSDDDDAWRACLNNNCNCINVRVSGKSVTGAYDYATHYLDLPDNGFDQIANNTSTSTTYTQQESRLSPATGASSAQLMLTQPLAFSAGNLLANGNQTVTAQLIASADFLGKVGVFVYDVTLQNCVATLQAGTVSLPANQECNCSFTGVLNLPDGEYYACLFYLEGSGQWRQVPQCELSCTAFTLTAAGRLPAAVPSYANVMPGAGGGVEPPVGGQTAAVGNEAGGMYASVDALDDHFYDDADDDDSDEEAFDGFAEEVFAKSVNDQEPFTCQRMRLLQKEMTFAGIHTVYEYSMGEVVKVSCELLNKHDTAQKRILTLSLYDKDDHWVTDLAERQVEVKACDTLTCDLSVRLVDVMPGAYKLRLTQAATTTMVSKPVSPAAASSVLIRIR